MATLSVNGYDLHYTAHISDRSLPTLLFIHGLNLDSSEWSLMTSTLGSGVNFVTYDLIGHGRTGYGRARLSFDRLVSEALALADALRLDKVDLVGSGFGGNIAYEFARRYPDRVQSLILLSVTFYLPESDYKRMFSLHAQLIAIDRMLLEQKLMMENLYSPTPAKSNLFKAAFERIPTDFYQSALDLLMRTFDPKHFHFVDELGQLSVPTLVLNGSDDPVLPFQMAAVYSACIPNSRWFIIPEASHSIPLDQPEFSAYYIKKFVLSEKIPIPVLPVHEVMVDDFRAIVRSSFNMHSGNRHLLRMNIMHGVEVFWNGRSLKGKWNQRGAKELLLFLILHSGLARRSDMIDTFLQDLPPVQARNTLRVWISHLNKIFRNCPDPSGQEILMIGEDTVAINTDLSSDIEDYMKQLDELMKENKPLSDQAMNFIQLLRGYDPASFSTFRGDWIYTLTDEIEEKLATVLEDLLPLLKKKKMFTPMREILRTAQMIEPYDGYCEEKLAELQNTP
ncbi:alpha/beta hydrolase [Sporolactobacillus sp. THM7-4]|nr:alpha/beta hydrolase [Sporolactobacillus sp. THM7-4]